MNAWGDLSGTGCLDYLADLLQIGIDLIRFLECSSEAQILEQRACHQYRDTLISIDPACLYRSNQTGKPCGSGRLGQQSRTSSQGIDGIQQIIV